MKPTSRPVYSNDRTAPRMKKAKFSKQVISKELWKQFIKEHPEHPLSWAEFYKRWLDIAETIREQSIKNPLGVKLGYYTGELKLQFLPHKMKNEINHSMSEVAGEKVKNLHIVDRGKVAKIKWERRWAVKFNKMLQFFAFEPTREMNRMAKAHITEAPEKLRVARNTLGGYSVWRQLKLKK